MKEKRHWSISIKLWLAMTLLILVVMGGLGIAITWIFSDFYIQQKLDSLRNEAVEITGQLSGTSSWSERLGLIQTIKLTSGTQLVLLDPHGEVLAVAGSISRMTPRGPGFWMGPGGLFGGGAWMNPGGMGGLGRSQSLTNFFKQEYLNEVMAGNTLTIKAVPVSRNGAAGNGAAMLIAAVPVGDPVEGVLLLGTSPVPVQESINTFRRLILYTSLLALVLATFVSLLFARQVTRPLAIMHRAAGRLAHGDFQPVAGITSRDEIGDLANALNSMGESLRNHVTWLSEEKSLLEGIVAGISDAVIMLNADGELLYANEPAKALWQDNGNDNSDLQRQEQILTFLRDLINTPDSSEEEHILTLGNQVLQVANASLAKTEGMRGHVAVLRDVSASLRAEKERRDFLASVTHELRTPLHLIQGYLEAIQDNVIPEEEKPQHIELVLEEAKRLARLVQELQEMNRMEHGQNLHKENITAGEFFRDLKQLFYGRAQESGIKFEIQVEPEMRFLADRDRLMQVFINLLGNAFRHTARGKLVQIRMEQTDKTTAFAVRDEGEGISPEALGHIFERFYRVDKARSRKEGGMGLGLAIVKQIVEAHGGNIRVDSVLGQGSTFWLELPDNS